ncbi:MAG TPA: DinB family protein [bacterium]
MSYSNPAGQAKAAASAYVAALLKVVGDRDPIAVQEQLLNSLTEAITGFDEAELRRPEKPGKWSIIEVIKHLADGEMVIGFRLRMILAHDRPPITAYDQDLWASELKYNEARLEETLSQLRALREANLQLLRSLTTQQWQRFGIHAERGEESVERLAKMVAGHDLVHLSQIERIKRAIR